MYTSLKGLIESYFVIQYSSQFNEISVYTKIDIHVQNVLLTCVLYQEIRTVAYIGAYRILKVPRRNALLIPRMILNYDGEYRKCPYPHS